MHSRADGGTVMELSNVQIRRSLSVRTSPGGWRSPERLLEGAKKRPRNCNRPSRQLAQGTRWYCGASGSRSACPDRTFARAIELPIQILQADSESEIDEAFTSLRADALLVGPGPF